jgi:hypothetical protein
MPVGPDRLSFAGDVDPFDHRPQFVIALTPFDFGFGRQLHAVAECGEGDPNDVVGDGKIATGEGRLGAGGLHQRDSGSG